MAFPSWLPLAPSGDAPIVYADFVNGLYWASGAIQPTADDLFFSDPDWGPFDSSAIVPGSGFPFDSNNSPSVIQALIAAALAALPVTLLATLYTPDQITFGSYLGDFEVFEPTFAYDGYIDVMGGGPGLFAEVRSPDGSGSTVDGLPQLYAGGVVTAAANFSQTDTVGSVGGTANVTSTAADPGVSPTSVVFTTTSGVNGFLRVAAVYPGQPDADLPLMSFSPVQPPKVPGNFSNMIFSRVSFG